MTFAGNPLGVSRERHLIELCSHHSLGRLNGSQRVPVAMAVSQQVLLEGNPISV